jgi:type VI secretion system protein ImpA
MTLTKELDKLIKFFNNQLALAGDTKDGDVPEGGAGEETAPASEAPAQSLRAAASPAAGNTVNIGNYKPGTRADALLLLKKVIEYYQNMEPNSPIPLLLNRAVRMAQMNFLELLESMVPEALPHGKEILGVPGTTPAPGNSRPQPAAPAAAAPAAASPETPSIPRIPRIPPKGS